MNPLVCRVWAYATIRPKCVRIILATSRIGATFERSTLVHHVLSVSAVNPAL
jgi:hypothetical protein